MAMPGGDGDGIYPIRRNAGEVAELRRFCGMWQQGSERFWAFDDILQALSRPGSLSFFAAPRQEDPWEGVILAEAGPFTTDLLYVYVDPKFRHAGIGLRLVKRLIDEVRSRTQMEALLLEVRASNLSAQRLYVSLGMTQIDRRKAYYSDGEDALIYKLTLRNP